MTINSGAYIIASAEFNLVVKTIATGLEHTANLSFNPDLIFAQTQYLLGSADPAAWATPAPVSGQLSHTVR